ASVRPGLIEPNAGQHEVVWWDPRALHLDQEGDEVQDALLRRILHEDDGQSLAAYHTWQEARAATIQTASIPKYNVFLASHPTGSAMPPPRLSKPRWPRRFLIARVPQAAATASIR